MNKTSKRILSLVLCLILTLSVIPLSGFKAEAVTDAVTTAINNLRNIYKDGEYWNKYSSSDYSKSGTKKCYCSGFCSGTCSCLCGQYYSPDGTWRGGQCHGFAMKMGYRVFGKDPATTWTKYSTANNLCAGDIVRYRPSSSSNYDHTIFITKVSGNTVTYVDCNSVGPCTIKWDRTTYISTINTNISRALYSGRGNGFVWHCPGNTSKGGDEAPTESQYVATDFNATVKDGTYTFKTLQTGYMLNVYNGANADGTKLTTWERDGTDDEQFYVKHIANGKYLIHAVCSGTSPSNYSKVVDVNVGSNGTIDCGNDDLGDIIDIWTRGTSWDNCQLFYIVPMSDGSYVFELVSTPSAVISCKNATLAGTNGGAITLRPYVSGFLTQRWTFYNAAGTTQVDPSIDSTGTSTTYYTGTYKVTATDGLNVRSGAGTSFTKLETLTYNTVVNVTQINGSWGYIEYEGTCGWICLDYTSYQSALLSSISLNTNPAKTSYYVGDTLNTSGLVINLNYSNSTTGTVSSGFTCSPTTLSTVGAQSITVSFGGKSTSFNVSVTAVAMSSIDVETNPTKTSYYVGDTLDTTGLTLTATNNNGSTSTISSGFTCSPTTLSTVGAQSITVSYGGKSTSFNVSVTAVTLSSIDVETNPTKTSYYVGDTLDTTGLTLTATNNNGSTSTISSGFTCTPTTLSTAGTQSITVSYNGKSTSFGVSVIAVTLSSIAVKTNPTKSSYYVGDTFDTTGLTLTATNNNESTSTISGGFTCSPTTLSMAGTQTIIVTYGGKTTTFVITVISFANPILSVSTTAFTANNIIVTITYPVYATVKEYKIGEDIWIPYTVPVILSANNTVYARCSDAAGNSSGIGSIVVSNISNYVKIMFNNAVAGNMINVKVPWYRAYKKITMQLGFETNISAYTKALWFSDNSKVVVDNTGKITNVKTGSRSATISVKLYDANDNIIASNTVKVVFYKYNWQLKNLQSQSVVSDDYLQRNLSVQELEAMDTAEPIEIEETTGLVTSTGEPIVTSSASEITTSADESVKITDSEELVQIANEPVEAADSIITTQAVKETVANNSSNGFMQSTIEFLSYILSIILKISF